MDAEGAARRQVRAGILRQHRQGARCHSLESPLTPTCSNRLARRRHAGKSIAGGGPGAWGAVPYGTGTVWDGSRTVLDSSKLSYACLRRSMLRTFRGTR